MKKMTRLKLMKILSIIAFSLFAVAMIMLFGGNSFREDMDEKYMTYLDAEPDSVTELYMYNQYSDAYDFYSSWLMIVGFLIIVLGGILFALMLVVLSIKEKIEN